MFQKWCEVTSCNGISDLYEARNNKKQFVFWSVVMSIMFVVSIWFTYRTICGYIETPTVTSVATVATNLLSLPEALICYNGGMNVSALKEKNFSDQFIRSFQWALNYITQPKWNGGNYTEPKKELEVFLKTKNLSIFDVVQKFGFKCEDIVTDLSRPLLSHQTKCDGVDYLTTSAGNCLVIGNNGKQWYPGLWGGVSISLKIPENSYVDFFPGDAFGADLHKSFSISFESCLHYQQSKRSVLIPTNTKAEITLNPKLYIRQGAGDRCRNLNNTYTSTSNACSFSCWKQGALSVGNCVPLDIYLEHEKKTLNACNPFEFPVPNFPYRDILECNKKCLPSCEEWVYDPIISYSNWDSVTPNGTQSLVFFGFNNMQYTKIEEVQAFTLDMAIANVGGQSGLWLGASIVTFIQALYYAALWMGQKIRFGESRFSHHK